jgi:hypothetical protein
MTVALSPNIAGFLEADKRKRELLGTKAEFQIPTVPVWPEGTRINPDTDLPYDAVIQPTNEAFTVIEKTILIILKQGSPLRPQADTLWEPAGNMEGMDIILDISAADYADVEEASEMLVNTLRYKIEEAKPFSLANTIYRWLLYGKER